MGMLEKLKLTDEVRSRLQFFPNGYAAMKWLAASGKRPTSASRRSRNSAERRRQVRRALPETSDKATYSAALASRAAEPDLARHSSKV
jgi:hypothetical protein